MLRGETVPLGRADEQADTAGFRSLSTGEWADIPLALAVADIPVPSCSLKSTRDCPRANQTSQSVPHHRFS